VELQAQVARPVLLDLLVELVHPVHQEPLVHREPLVHQVQVVLLVHSAQLAQLEQLAHSGQPVQAELLVLPEQAE
jgi:hypothetical protein